MQQKLLEAFKSDEWRSTFIDRIIRSALQGYAAVWLASGTTYDGLFSLDPIKGAVVAAVLSVLFSLGATQTKDPTNNSYTR